MRALGMVQTADSKPTSSQVAWISSLLRTSVSHSTHPGSLRTTTAPPMVVLWPSRYLVVEWMAKSAPKSRARWP